MFFVCHCVLACLCVLFCLVLFCFVFSFVSVLFWPFSVLLFFGLSMFFFFFWSLSVFCFVFVLCFVSTCLLVLFWPVSVFCFVLFCFALSWPMLFGVCLFLWFVLFCLCVLFSFSLSILFLPVYMLYWVSLFCLVSPVSVLCCLVLSRVSSWSVYVFYFSFLFCLLFLFLLHTQLSVVLCDFVVVVQSSSQLWELGVWLLHNGRLNQKDPSHKLHITQLWGIHKHTLSEP